MKSLFPQIVLTAIRDRLFASLVLGLIVIVMASSFAGSQSLVEQPETSAVFAGFGARLLIVLGMALFALTAIRRAFDSGEIMLQLSRPLSRSAYAVSWFFSLWLISLLLVVVAMAAIELVAPLAFRHLAQWAAGVTCEAGLLIAFALFVAFGLETIVGGFCLTVAFYVLARSIGGLLALSDSEFRNQPTHFDAAIGQFCHILGLVMPRLDLLSSQWLLHGIGNVSVPVLLAQIVAGTGLCLGAAMFDLERKQL